MKITRKKTVTEEKTVLDDILCNKCGASLKVGPEGITAFEGLIETSVRGGYFSKLGDMNHYQFSLCEDCLEDLFKTFKHDPLVLDEHPVIL